MEGALNHSLCTFRLPPMKRLFVSVGPSDTGLAVARALKRGLPDLSITALSRAPHGPALNADVFDDAWTVPSWADLDHNVHANEISNRLDGQAGFLPTSPAETHWLSAALPSARTAFTPSTGSLSQTDGPEPDAAAALSMSVPPWMPLSAPVEDLHAFGRRHNWDVCVRGPLGRRTPLPHWTQFDEARDAMVEQTGNPDRLYLQRQVPGTPVFLSFAAHEGRLLDAVLLRPGTDQRNTVEPTTPASPLHSALSEAIDALHWTGGGRLTCVEDDDTWWFDTWRPCFGREVAGLARCGVNLPAELVAVSTNGTAVATAPTQSVFSLSGTGLRCEQADSASKPGGTRPPLPDATLPAPSSPRPSLTASLQAVVDDLPFDETPAETPRTILLPSRTQERFEAFSEAADRLEAAFALDTARIGLSIKTNPADRLLATARNTDMLAETIHPDEMAHAREHGFDTSEIIVNGPVQALLPNLDTAPYALFGDALSDLASLPFDPSGTIIGVRTRPPERGPSRFGVDLSDPERMDRLCDRLGEFPAATRIGLHLHAPSSTLGHDRWWDSLERVLTWAQTIQDRTGRPVRCLDLGGGWHPDDWLDVFIPGLLERRSMIQGALPDLDTLLLEPGKALSQPLGVVVSRVLDVRPTRSEVILDASLAELSNIDYHPHRLLAHTEEQGWHRLPRGEGRLLGRLCMEADILGRHRQVDHLSVDDTVVVCDAGAYDASMTYPFGRGTAQALQ